MASLFGFLASFIARGLVGLGLNATLAGALGNIVVGVSALAISAALRPRQPQPPSAEYQAVLNQSTAERKRGYGRAKLGGPRAFWDSREGDLDQIVMLHHGEISEVKGLFLGDKRVETNEEGAVLTEPWHISGGESYAYMQVKLGAPNQTVLGKMRERWPEVWTEDHRLRGIAVLWARFNNADPDSFGALFPESYNTPIRAICDLSPVLDPRTGETGWSDNPALCIRDYLLHPDGFRRLKADDIHDPDFIALADLCDEMVTKADGTEEKRYRLWGLYSLRDEPKTVLARMCATCDAELYETSDGKVGIRGGKWEEPTVIIGPEHILSVDMEEGNDKFAAFNHLKIIYTDPSQDFQPVEARAWQNLDNKAEFGEISEEIQIDMVPSASQAQRLGKLHAHKENPRWRGSIVTDLFGLQARGERIIRVQIPALDIDDTFRVISHGVRADLTGCEIGLSSLSETAYFWRHDQEEGDAAPPPKDTSPDITQASSRRGTDVGPDRFIGSDADKLEAAFSQAATTGRDLTISRNFNIDRPLNPIVVTGRLMVKGLGNIHVAQGITNAVQIVSNLPLPVDIESFTQTTHNFPWDATTASEATLIKTVGAHGCLAGNMIKIVAEDQIAQDPVIGRKIGEHHYAADVTAADEIWISGRLRDSYNTSPRLQLVPDEPDLTWDGPTFSSSPNVEEPTNCAYLTVRGFIQPDIKTGFRDIYGVGITILSCFQAKVEAEGIRALNRVSSRGISGYFIQDSCSEQTTAHIESIDARHAYTTNGVVADTRDDTWRYGRTIGSVVTGSGSGGSAADCDVHSNAADCTMLGFTSASTRFGEAASGAAIQLRGIRTRAIDCLGNGNQQGLEFNAATAGDCVDCLAQNFNYNGLGDGIRINQSSGTTVITRPVIKGGLIRTARNRSVAAWRCTRGVIEGLHLAPFGSIAFTAGILVGTGAELLVRNLYIDLSNYAGTNFRAFALDAGSSGVKLIVESATVIGAAGKFQAWLSGATTGVGEVTLRGLRSDANPSSGDVINSAGLTLIRLERQNTIPTWTGEPGEIVRNTDPAAGGTSGWIWVPDLSAWKALEDVAA